MIGRIEGMKSILEAIPDRFVFIRTARAYFFVRQRIQICSRKSNFAAFRIDFTCSAQSTVKVCFHRLF